MNPIEALSVAKKLVCDSPWIKAIGGIAGAAAVWVFPTPALQQMALGALVLVLCDTLTGVWASIVTGKGVSSARLARVITKLLGYGAASLVCATVGQTVPGLEDFQAACVGLILGFVIATEGVSILENVRRMGVRLPAGLTKLLREQLSVEPEKDTRTQ